MSWIKDFRKAYGLSQLQLAQFAGLSRNHLSMLEVRKQIPAGLHTLFLELKQAFDQADENITDETVEWSEQKRAATINQIQQRLFRKTEQLERLQRQTISLEKRYQNLNRLQQVCLRWRDLKSDSDPAIDTKIAAIQAKRKQEIRKCGPAAQTKIRIRMAILVAEIEISSEEIKYFSGF